MDFSPRTLSHYLEHCWHCCDGPLLTHHRKWPLAFTWEQSLRQYWWYQYGKMSLKKPYIFKVTLAYPRAYELTYFNTVQDFRHQSYALVLMLHLNFLKTHTSFILKFSCPNASPCSFRLGIVLIDPSANRHGASQYSDTVWLIEELPLKWNPIPGKTVFILNRDQYASMRRIPLTKGRLYRNRVHVIT